MSGASAARATVSLSPRHRVIVTVSTTLAAFMQALDQTIANIALPHMQGSLSAAQDTITWVLTSYIVSAAIATPTTAWFARRFGTRRVLLAAILAFTIASGLCGMAQNISQMVVFRILQGMFGGALAPLSQSILLDIYPREKQGQAMTFWGAGVMIAPLLGPTLGGWLTDNYNWRWIFYINLPIGILTFSGVAFFVGEAYRNRKIPFDVLGFVLLTAGIGSLQLLFDRGQQKDWFQSREIIVETLIAGLGIWMFLVHSFTSEQSVINLKIFKDRNFTIACALMFCLGQTFLGTLAILPSMIQNLLGYPVSTAGLLFLPRGVTMLMSMLIVGRTMAFIDRRIFLVIGFSASSVSLWMMAHFSLDMGWQTIVYSGLVQGVGMGFLFAPLTALAFSTLPAQHRAEGTSMLNLLRNIGSSIGISMIITNLSRATQISRTGLVASLTPFDSALQNPSLSPFWDIHTTAGLTALDSEMTRQATMIAYNHVFMTMLVIGLLVAFAIFLLRKPSSDAELVMMFE